MDKTSQYASFENNGDGQELSFTSGDHNLHHQTQLMWDGGGKHTNSSGLSCDKAAATSSCRRKSSSPGRSSYPHQKQNSLRVTSKVSSAHDSHQAPVTSSETAKCSFSPTCSENITLVQKHGKNSLSAQMNKTMSSLNQLQSCQKSSTFVNKSVSECGSENQWKSAPNFSSMVLAQESQPDSQYDTTAQMSSSISDFNHSCNNPKTVMVQKALQEQKVIPISSNSTHVLSNSIHHLQSSTETFLSNKYKSGLDVKSNTKENVPSPCNTHHTVGDCTPCEPDNLCLSGENNKKPYSGKRNSSVEQHPVPASSLLASTASKSSATILQVPKFPPPLQHQCQQPFVGNFQNDALVSGNNSGEIHSQKMLADLLHIHLLNMVAAAATNGNSNISPGNVGSGFDLGVAVSLLGAASLLSGNFFPCVHHQTQGSQSSLQPTKVVQSQGTSPLRVADEKQTQTTPPISPVIRMCETHIIDSPKTKPKTKSEEVSSGLSTTFASPTQNDSLQKAQRKEFGCFFSSKKSFFKPKRKIEAIVANLKEQKSVVSPVSSTSVNSSSGIYLTSSLVQNASVDDLKCDWIPDSSTEASDLRNNSGRNAAQIEICDSVEGVDNSVNEEAVISVCEWLSPKIEENNCKTINHEQQCNKIEASNESPNRMKNEDSKVLSSSKPKETKNTPGEVEHEHNGNYKSFENIKSGASKTGEIDAIYPSDTLCTQLPHQNVFSIHVTKSVKSDNCDITSDYCNTSLQCDLKANIGEKLFSKVIAVSRNDGDSSEISTQNDSYSVCDKSESASHSCGKVKSRPISLSHCKLSSLDNKIISNPLPESNIVHSSLVNCDDCFSPNCEKHKLHESSSKLENPMLPFQLTSVGETICVNVPPVSLSVDNVRTNIVSSNRPSDSDTKILCGLQKNALNDNAQSSADNCDLSLTNEFDKSKFCVADCSDDAMSKSEIKSVGQDDSLPVSTSVKSEVLAYDRSRLCKSRIEDTSSPFPIDHNALVDTSTPASSSQGSEPSLRQFNDVQVEERDYGNTVSSSHNVITPRGTKPVSPECFNLDSDSHLDDSDQVVPCVESEPEDQSPREGKVICSLVLSDLLSEVVEKTVKVFSNTNKDNETNSKEMLEDTSISAYISHNTDLFKNSVNDTVLCNKYETDDNENSTPINVIYVPKHCDDHELSLKNVITNTDDVNHSTTESDPTVCESQQNLDSISTEKINETQGKLIKQDFISHNSENNDTSICQEKCKTFQNLLIPVTDMPKPFSSGPTVGKALSESNTKNCDISHDNIKGIMETTDNIPFIQDSSYLENNLQIISEMCNNVEAAISEEKSTDLLSDSNTCITDCSADSRSDQKVAAEKKNSNQIISRNILPDGDGCLQYNQINSDSIQHTDSSPPPLHTSSDNIDLKEISFESRGHTLQERSSVTKCQQMTDVAESGTEKHMSNNFERKYLKEDNSNLQDNQLKILPIDFTNENSITAQKMILCEISQDASSEVLNEDSSSVSVQDMIENVTAEDYLTDNRNSSDALCEIPCKSNILSLIPENKISTKPVMTYDGVKTDALNEIDIKNSNNDVLSETCVSNKEDNIEKSDYKEESTGQVLKRKRQKNSVSVHCKLPLDRLPNSLLEKLSVPEHYQFRLDKGHRTEKGFSCDICASIYKRAFSLKRHYLRSHISYRYLSNRDIANCAIVVGDKMAIKAVPPKKGNGHFPGLYRCHICGECFDDKIDGLRLHLINHPSNVSAEPVPASKLDGALCHDQSIDTEENKLCTERKDNSSSQLPTDADASISKHLCLYCDKKFSSATVKRRHQRRVHQNPQPYKRKQLPVTDTSNLINGTVNVRKRRRKCKSRLHKCPYCEHRSATFTELAALVRHLKRNHQNIYHACVPCGERFCKKEELDFHIASGHSKNKFVPSFSHNSTVLSTEACGKKINAETNTSMNFCHICPICSKMFTNYRNMCRHKQLAHRNSGTTVSPVTLSPCKSRFINLLLSSESPSTTSFSSSTTSSSTSSSIGSSRSQSPFVNVPVLLNVDVEEQLPISVVSNSLSNGRPIKQKIKKIPQSSAFQTMTRSMAEISSEHTAEAELLFYNSIATNIRENLLHYLDGKLTKHLVDRVDSNSKEEIVIREDFSSITEMKHQSDVEKGKAQDHAEKNISESPQPNIRLYLSQLDISTQLAMGKNIEKATQIKENQHEDDVPLARVAERVNKESDSFHAGLKLVRNNSRIIKYLAGSTNCQNSPQTEKSDSRKDLQLQTARSHLDSSGRNTRSTALKLRRSVLEHSPLPVTSKQPDINASNDESTASAGMFLSGEWVRPRSYICGACSQTFTDLYEIEEHKIIVHPNVWCNHYELDEDFALSQSENQRLLPSDLCRRHLQPQGALGNISHSLQLAATLNRLKHDLKCTKCGKVNFSTPSEFHRHLLECGGDTSWLYGAYSPGGTGGTSGSGNSRRSRKWRPFGSRRRRQQGHKAIKRNVTSTPPTKASSGKTHHRHYRHHTHQSHRLAAKEGDTIQRMIANLPPKRSTRHAIMFDAIKSRRKAAAFMVNVKHTRRAGMASAAHAQNDKRPLLSRRAKIAVQHTQSNVISQTLSSDSNKSRLLRERSITPVKLKHNGLNGRNHSVPPPVPEDISARLRSRRRGSLPPENLKSPLDIEAGVIESKNKMFSDLKPKLQNVGERSNCLLKGTKQNSDLNTSIKASNKISKETMDRIENTSIDEKKNNQHLSKTMEKKNSEKKVKVGKGTVLLRKEIVNSNAINKTKSQNTLSKQQKKNRTVNVEIEDTDNNESIFKKSKNASVTKNVEDELQTFLNSGTHVQNNIKVKLPRVARNQGCTTGKFLHVDRIFSSENLASENVGSIKNEKVKHKLENVSDMNQVKDSIKSVKKLVKIKNKENKKKSHQSSLQMFTKTKTEKQFNLKHVRNTCIDKHSNEGTSPCKKNEATCDTSKHKQDVTLKEKIEDSSPNEIQSSENAAVVKSKIKCHKKGKIKIQVKNKFGTIDSGTDCDLQDDHKGVIANNISQKNPKRKKSVPHSCHEENLFDDITSNSEKCGPIAYISSQNTNSKVEDKKCPQENYAESNLNSTIATSAPINEFISLEPEPLSEERTSSCIGKSISDNQPSLSIVCKEPIKQTKSLPNKTCGNESLDSAKLCDLNRHMQADTLFLIDLVNEEGLDQKIQIKENALNNKFKDVKEESFLKIRNQRKMKQKIDNKTIENIKAEQEISSVCLDNITEVRNDNLESSSIEMIDSTESNPQLLSNDDNSTCNVTSAKTSLSRSVNEETSDILAAMRIAMMEGDVNETNNDETKRKVESSEIHIRKKLKSDKTEVINESIQRKLCHQCGKSFAYTTPFWRHIQQCKNRNKKKYFNMPTLQIEEPIVKRTTRSSKNTEVDDSIPILSPIDRGAESSMIFISGQGIVNHSTDARLSKCNSIVDIHVHSLDNYGADETIHEVLEDDVVLSDLVKSKMIKTNINCKVGRLDILGDTETCSKITEKKLTLTEADLTNGKDAELGQITESSVSKLQVGNEKCLDENVINTYMEVKFEKISETKVDQKSQQQKKRKSESMEKNVIGKEKQKTVDMTQLVPCKSSEYVNNDSKPDEIKECDILYDGKLTNVDQMPVECVNNRLCSATLLTDETKLTIPTDEILKERNKDFNNTNTCVESCASKDAVAVTSAITVENFLIQGNRSNGEVIEKHCKDISSNFITSTEFHSNHIHDAHENMNILRIEEYKLSFKEQVIPQSKANNSISQVIDDSISNANVSNNALEMLPDNGDLNFHKSKTCDKYNEFTYGSSTLNINKNFSADNHFSLNQVNLQNLLVRKNCCNTNTSNMETPSKVRRLGSKDTINSKVVKNACRLRKKLVTKFNNFSPTFTKTCRMKKSKMSRINPCRKIVPGRKVNGFNSYGKYNVLSKKLQLSYEVKHKREKIKRKARSKLREKIRLQQQSNSSVKPNIKESISKQCDQNIITGLDAKVCTYNISKLYSESKTDDCYRHEIKSLELSSSELIYLNENSEKKPELSEENQIDEGISKKKMDMIETTEVSQNIIKQSLIDDNLPQSIEMTSPNVGVSVFVNKLEKYHSPLNKCDVDNKLLNTEVTNMNNLMNNIPQIDSIQYNESLKLSTPLKEFEVMEISNLETAVHEFSSNESNLENEIYFTNQNESHRQGICRKVKVGRTPNHTSTEIQMKKNRKESLQCNVETSRLYKTSAESQDITNKDDELNSLLTEDIISAAVAISQLKDKSREHIPLITTVAKDDSHSLEFSFHKNKKSANSNSKLLSKEAEEMISTAVAITQLSDIGNGSHSQEINETEFFPVLNESDRNTTNNKKSGTTHLHCHQLSDIKSGDRNESADSEVVSPHFNREQNDLFLADYCEGSSQQNLDESLIIMKSDIIPSLSSNFIVNSDVNKSDSKGKTAEFHKRIGVKSGYNLFNNDTATDSRHTQNTSTQSKVKLQVTNKKFENLNKLVNTSELVKSNLNMKIDSNTGSKTRQNNDCSETNEGFNNIDHVKKCENELIDLDISKVENIHIRDVSTQEKDCVTLNNKSIAVVETSLNSSNGTVVLHEILRDNSEIEHSSVANRNEAKNSFDMDVNNFKVTENKNIDNKLLKSSEDSLNKIECRNIFKFLEHENKQSSEHSEINNDTSSETILVNSFISDGSHDNLFGNENECIASMAQAHSNSDESENKFKNETVYDNTECLDAENERIHETSKILHSLKRTEPINEKCRVDSEISMKSYTHEHTTSKKCEDTQNTMVQCDASNVVLCQANGNYDNKLENYNHLMESNLLELFARDDMNITVPLCTSNTAEPCIKSLSDDEDIPLSLSLCINSDLKEEEKESKGPELTKYSNDNIINLQPLNKVFSDCEEEYDIPLSLRTVNIVPVNERKNSELESNANCEFSVSVECLKRDSTQRIGTEFNHSSNIEYDQMSEEIVGSEQSHDTTTLSIKVTLPLRPTLEHTRKEIISSSALKRKVNNKKIENVCLSPKLPLSKHAKRISKKATISGKTKAIKEKNCTIIKDQYLQEEFISNPKDCIMQITSKVANHSEAKKNSNSVHNKHCENGEANISNVIDKTCYDSFNKSNSLLQVDDTTLYTSRPRRLAKEVALKEVRNHYLMDGEFELLVDDETISSSTLDELSFYMDEISQKGESSATDKAKITSKSHIQDKKIQLLRSEDMKDKKNKSKEKLRASGNSFEENNLIEKSEVISKTVTFEKTEKPSIKENNVEQKDTDISPKLKFEDNCCSSNTTSLPMCDHESIVQDEDFQNIELKKDVKKQPRKRLGKRVEPKILHMDLGEETTCSAQTIEKKTSDNINSEKLDMSKEIIVTANENNVKDLVKQSINDCGLSKEFTIDCDPKSDPQKEIHKQCEQSNSRQNVNYKDILKYPNLGNPLILSRRERSTRCNLSYEEMYTSSDVSSDSDSQVEISSQSLTSRTCTKQRRGNCRRSGVTGRIVKQNSESIIKSIVQNRNVNTKESVQKSEVGGFEESTPVGQKRKRKIKKKPHIITSKELSDDEDHQEAKRLKKFYCFHCKKNFLSSYNFDKHMRSNRHRNKKAIIPIVGVEKNPGPIDDDVKHTQKSRIQCRVKDNFHLSIKDSSSYNSPNKSAEESETEISCIQESGWEKRVAIHNSLCEILKAKSAETIVKVSLRENYHNRKQIADTDPVTSSEDTTVASCDAVFKMGSEDPDISNVLDAALVIEETATVTSPSDGSVWPSPAATTLTGGTEEIIEPSSNHSEVNTTSQVDKLWETKKEPEWHRSELPEEEWDKKPDQSAAPHSRCWENDVDWTRTHSEVTTGTEWAANEAVPWDIDLHKSSQEWRVVSTSEHAPWQPHNQQNESNNWVDDEQWQGAPSWGHGEASSLVSIMDSVSQSLQILESRVAADDEGQLQSSELTSHLYTTPHHQNTAPSLQELQTAMGATDEEMAMLQQLGGGSWVSGGVAETDIIDLDKQQETENTCEVSGIELAKTTDHEKKYETMSISKEDCNQKSLMLPVATQHHPRAPNFEKDRLLAPYETKEMVCPACHRFFLGLTSLQKHVSIAHNGDTKGQSTIHKRSTTGISRKASSVSGASTSWSGCSQQQAAVAAISASANSLPRVPCPVCRELLVDDEAVSKHKQENHAGDPDLPSRSLANAEDSSNSSINQTTETGSKEDAEGLKSHISTALGGLLDRALNNYLERGLKPGINQPTLSILQTLTAKRSTPLSPSPRYNAELVKQCRKELIGKQPSGSAGAERIDEPHPYSCNFCDSRFLQQSTLNRHVDHCHRNSKKDTLIREDSKDYTSAGEDSDHSWRESSPVDWNTGTAAGEIGDFLCSDCGINFSTPQEVLKHRKLEHCTHPDPQASQPSSLKSNRSNRGRSWKKDLDIDGDTIKAQAVAALRELGNQGRKCGGTAARKAKWGMKFPLASQLPTHGVGSPQSVGFSYPLVRKAPVDGKRFASLVEKKKRNAKKPTENLAKDFTSDPRQLDVYEFADDEVKPPDLRVPTQAKLQSEVILSDSNVVQQNSSEVELPFVERCQRRERRRKSCADLPSDISDVIDDSDSSVGGRPRKMRRARGAANRRRRRRTGRLSLDTTNIDVKTLPSTEVGNETSDEDDDGAQTECKRQCPLIGEEEDKLSQSSTDIGVVKPVGPAPSPGESCKKAAARQRRAKSDLLISVFRKCKRSSATVTPTHILDSTSISSCSDAESIAPAPL